MIFWMIFCITLILGSCNESDVNYLTGSTAVPAQVSNVRVDNFPGSAVIRYELPDDINMKYVRATYVVDGVTRDINASFYTDSLLVEGFPSAGEYTVSLYSVSYGGTQSEPVIVNVHPGTPPYLLATKKMGPSFGGLWTVYEYAGKGNLSVGVVKKMDNGQWVQIHMEYSITSKYKLIPVRGQASVPSEFGVFVRDRWGHVSDTVFGSFTPWYEEICDKKLFSNAALPTDEYICHTWGGLSNGNHITKLWDEVTDQDPTFQTRTTTYMPQQFTVNLGKKYQLSRFIMNSRYYKGPPEKFGNVYDMGHPRYFEIWGSVNPNPDGSYDDTWFKIADYESIRPSGLTTKGVPYSEEDKAMARSGEEFMIPEGTPAVQYIRFKTIETWGKTRYMHLHELTPYGSPLE